MQCDCNQQSDIFQITDYGTFVSRLEIVATKSEGWIQLGRCRACGQHWQVDKWDKYQVLCAIKIANPEDWDNFTDEESRMQLLIRSRGGLSSETCMWIHCENQALKNLAFCPYHAWEKGLRA